MKTSKLISGALIMSLFITGCQSSTSGTTAESESSVQTTEIEAQATENDSTSDASGESAADHVESLWEEHLSVLEDLYETSDWLYGYIDEYTSEKSWEALSRARTACMLAGAHILELDAVEDDITEEEYALLSAEGVETAYISDEFEDLTTILEDNYNNVRYCQAAYLEDYLTEEMFSALEENNLSNKDILEYSCTYEYMLTDYLFVQMYGESEAGIYLDDLKQNYPLIFADYDTVLGSNEAESEMRTLEKRFEDEIQPAKYEAIDDINTAMNDYNEALKENDREVFAAMTVDIQDLPQMLPAPYWYDCTVDSFKPYTENENGEMEMLTYPADLDTTAIYGMVEIRDISEEAFESYLDSLADDGIKVTEKDEAGKWSIVFTSYVVEVIFSDETVNFLFYPEDVTFTDNLALLGGE